MFISVKHCIKTYLVAILKTSVAQTAVLYKKYPVIFIQLYLKCKKCKKKRFPKIIVFGLAAHQQ